MASMFSMNSISVTMMAIILAGGVVMAMERLWPARALPQVRGWWGRVVLINLLQAGMVFLGGLTWERWLQKSSLFHLTDRLGVPVSALVGYLLVTFIYYFWHRWRHDSRLLWNHLHQLHHSARRIELVTSFYKHPLEILANSILISATSYCLLGLSLEAGGWVIVLTSYAEFFYHMNVRTPHWVGYLVQRPEAHRVHHQLGRHYNNFADLPIWDMLFGTFHNPRNEEVLCGFRPEREVRFLEMLAFKDVNGPMGGQRAEPDDGAPGGR